MSDIPSPFVDGRTIDLAMGSAREFTRVIEACASAGTQQVLLPARSLPPGFFDVSSGEAGEILQKLRNYAVRMAVVRDASVSPSTRFPELMADERRHGAFGLFDSEAEAVAWLVR